MRKAKGYVVDNLGLPVWLANKIREEYDGKTIHYAIQQILKERYSK